MPPRVAYWLSSFEPEMEAVAGEVACLRRAFPGSVAWGVSGRDGGRFSWSRGLSFPPRWYHAFTAATWLAQRAFQVNHLFGGLGDWFHLKAVRKRPIVLTVALDGPACRADLLAKVDCFAVEWPAGRGGLSALGIEPDRIRLVYPPVDVDRFRPAAPDPQFTVLFASSPDRADWIEARGAHLVLDAAALCPELRFRLVWRPWGDSLPAIRRQIEQRGLRNVELTVGRFGCMEQWYQRAHVTAAPFTRPERCKPAPNSVVESLACGRPVVVTAKVGLADLIQEERIGLVCAESGDAMADALRQLQNDWESVSKRSRLAAERLFAARHFVEAYTRLYQQLL